VKRGEKDENRGSTDVVEVARTRK